MAASDKPSTDDLRFAAEWLRQYDDSHDGGEQTAAAERVAQWLCDQADARDLRDAAREHGMPVGRLRQAVRDRS